MFKNVTLETEPPQPSQYVDTAPLDTLRHDMIDTRDTPDTVEFAVKVTAYTVALPSEQCSTTACGPLNADTYVHVDVHTRPPPDTVLDDAVQFSAANDTQLDAPAHVLAASGALEFAPNTDSVVVGGGRQPPTPM